MYADRVRARSDGIAYLYYILCMLHLNEITTQKKKKTNKHGMVFTNRFTYFYINHIKLNGSMAKYVIGMFGIARLPRLRHHTRGNIRIFVVRLVIRSIFPIYRYVECLIIRSIDEK